jgi:hypothetical protein
MGKFKVRGCHGTVHTVDLPPSVPPKILNHMVDLLQSRLRRELDIMADSPGDDGPDRSSMESDCFSTLTNEGGSDTNIEDDIPWIAIQPTDE